MNGQVDTPLEDPSTTRQRVRLGLVVLLVGVGLLLVALGMALLRGGTSSPELIAEDGAVRPAVDGKTRAVVGTVALVFSTILLLVLVLAAVTLVMVSRRYRRYLFRKQRAPTPTDSIWSRHRLPEGWSDTPGEFEEDEPPESGAPE